MDSIRSTVEAMTGEQDLGSPKDVTTQRAIQNTLNNLIGEIRRSIQFFQNQSPESPVTKLILGGGTANMLDLPAYLQQELNLPVEVIDPLRRIPVTGPDIDASLLKEQKNLLSVGIGLAMRKVVD
ncbi:pilus assembly protein PilM [bacterium]|nr:pilus assembly protein PilM [bacterium]